MLIFKNLILKSSNNLTFFLKNLRKTISSRMMILYQIQIVPVVPVVVYGSVWQLNPRKNLTPHPIVPFLHQKNL